MKIVIAGGGTGGHIFPAIAVANEIIKRGSQIFFIGTKAGLESKLVAEHGWQIDYLPFARLKGESRLSRMKSILMQPGLILKARKKLKKINPDLVVGVGGYASGPVVLAASIMKVPTLIMEQNSIPGLTNRILSKFVHKICVTFPNAIAYFKAAKVVLTGNPVRAEILDIKPELPSFKETFVLFCFGGSQGAKQINDAMLSSLKLIKNKKDIIHIIHQVGQHADIENIKNEYKREGISAEVYPFINDMGDCYSRSHLVICRAGATSITELMVTGRPSILIPYPYAANNHQLENAKYVEQNGGAQIVLNKDLNGEKISEIISHYMNKSDRLKEMSRACLAIAKRDAVKLIVDECFKLVA